MRIKEILESIGLPCAYSHFDGNDAPQEPPFLAYLGAGQSRFLADDTIYHKTNRYQIEYYFKKKSAATEERIENILLSNGFIYEKSEDVYIDSEDCFVIYYTI